MVHLAAGLVLVGLGIWGMASWWSLFGLVMRGVIPFTLLFTGMVAIMVSVKRMTRPALAAAPEPTRAEDLDFQSEDLLSEPRKVTDVFAVDQEQRMERELIRRGLVPNGR